MLRERHHKLQENNLNGGVSNKQQKSASSQQQNLQYTVCCGGIWWYLIAWTLGMLLAAFSFTEYSSEWVPPIQPKDAPNTTFSEIRAFKHVEVLARNIKDRQVSMPGLIEAASYIDNQIAEIQKTALSSGWNARSIRHEVNGAANLIFFHHNLTNAYANLTILGLLLTPIPDPSDPIQSRALIINSHFDAPIGSPGASDCASCVAINLELARKFAALPPDSVNTPLLFLFNGGEETFSQAAHGFMQLYHPNNTKLKEKDQIQFGAFINIESTGPGGTPVMFQHIGAWAAEAYIKTSILPRVTNVAQDFFDAGIIPADTDARMFSYRDYGWLPGIDMAFFKDAAAYHTDRDNVERIQAGSLQEVGETVGNLIPEMSRRIVKGEADVKHFQHRRMYFLNLPLYVICLSYWQAFVFVMFPTVFWVAIIAQVYFLNNQLVQLLNIKIIHSSLQTVWPITRSLLCGIFTTLLVGIIMGVSGFPLTWFSQQWLGTSLYVFSVFFGIYLPLIKYDGVQGIAQGAGGASILMSVIVIPIMVAVGKLGLAMIPAMWSYVLIISCIMHQNRTQTEGSVSTNYLVFASTGLYIVPVLAGTFASLGLVPHLMQKISMSGQELGGACHPEIIVSVITALSMFQCAFGFFPIWMQAIGQGDQGKVLARKLVKSLGLVVVSLLALSMTVFQNGYSNEMPKRLFIFYANKLDSSVGGQSPDILERKLVIGTLDGYKTEWVPGVRGRTGRIPLEGWELLALFPIQQIFEGVAFKVDQKEPLKGPVSNTPYINLVNKTSANQGVAQLNLEIVSERPGWGVLNITGDLDSWSFNEVVSIDQYQGKQFHLVRFASGSMDPFRWPFWLGVKQGGRVRVEFALIYLPITEDLQEVVKQMPSWTAIGYGTQYFGAWEFSSEILDT
eukprot:TRINITY_DN581_c1_g1_i6.p1 TRINITY_DN581_c1_g1~~TRINITY_DN581_c1_g1_i6.p1  ORF type:complete len:922 (+),score=66.77 TRINITY_DN581_c1_g1_i6:62-2767(+)